MEARRRRESAKANAATVLPSTRDREFHLRLINLYSKHQCLWNTSHTDYENKELKELAWQAIVKELGPHLSPGLLKSRICNLRHGLNVYKLQEIEYKMCPDNAKQPQKPFYYDQFGFLESQQQLTVGNQAKDKDKEPFQDNKKRYNKWESRFNLNESIASIVKQRLAEHPKLPMAALKKRLQMSMSSSIVNPNISPVKSQTSRLTAPSASSIMKARPGESVSQTKLIHNNAQLPSPNPIQHEEVESEDEELYQEHWTLRQKMSSRRQRSAAMAILKSLDQRNPKAPPMPLTIRSKPSTKANDDMI